MDLDQEFGEEPSALRLSQTDLGPIPSKVPSNSGEREPDQEELEKTPLWSVRTQERPSLLLTPPVPTATRGARREKATLPLWVEQLTAAFREALIKTLPESGLRQVAVGSDPRVLAELGGVVGRIGDLIRSREAADCEPIPAPPEPLAVAGPPIPAVVAESAAQFTFQLSPHPGDVGPAAPEEEPRIVEPPPVVGRPVVIRKLAFPVASSGSAAKAPIATRTVVFPVESQEPVAPDARAKGPTPKPAIPVAKTVPVQAMDEDTAPDEEGSDKEGSLNPPSELSAGDESELEAEPRPSSFSLKSTLFSVSRGVAVAAGAAALSFFVVRWAVSPQESASQTSAVGPMEVSSDTTGPAGSTAPAAVAVASAKSKSEDSPARQAEALPLPVGIETSPGQGLLEVVTQDRESIYVADAFMGTGPVRMVPLSQGSYELRIGSDGRREVHTVKVAAGQRTRLDLSRH